MPSASKAGRIEAGNQALPKRPTGASAERNSNTTGRRSPLRGSRLRGSASLQVSSSFKSVDELRPHALGVTYWVDTPDVGEAFDVKVRFTGRRIGVKGKPQSRDTFDVTETVANVMPGSGPVSVTRRVANIAEGNWHVNATAQRLNRMRKAVASTKLPRASSSGTTGYAPIIRIRAPGAVLGAWPALVGIGVLVALATQFIFARRSDLPTGQILLVSVLGSLIGLVGGKLYYAVEHGSGRKSLLFAGMCIQGFVLGAIGSLIAGSAMLGLPAGTVLDVTTPGLLLAMGIGRIGCFFGGCCVGRPTTSRWGLWSSDRHVGVRRIPTQLLESALALSIGVGAVAALTSGADPGGGVVFAVALAMYVLGRQLLFPLRDLGRSTRHGRTVAMLLAALVVVGAATVTLAN